jgi:hypothetical protein
MYAWALEDFFAWWNGQGRPPFTRAMVQAWRSALEVKGLAPASVNQKLSAVRKLAAEASYNGLLDPATAQTIRDIRGEQHGVRTGNWLTIGVFGPASHGHYGLPRVLLNCCPQIPSPGNPPGFIAWP